MVHPSLTLNGCRHRLLSRLREGATVQVWRALDARAGREVALKAIPLAAGGAPPPSTRPRRGCGTP